MAHWLIRVWKKHSAHIWVFNLLSKAGVSPLRDSRFQGRANTRRTWASAVPESKDMLGRGWVVWKTKDIGATNKLPKPELEQTEQPNNKVVSGYNPRKRDNHKSILIYI